MLRILQVAYKSQIYGGEKVLLDLVRGLMAKGHELFVACPSDGPLTEALRAEGAGVFVVPMGKTYDFRGILRLYTILRKYRIDVVHSHGLLVNILSRVASYLAGTHVSISTAHIPLNLKSGRQAQNVFEKMMIPYYLILDNLTSLFNDKIIAVSHAVRNDLIEQGVNPEKIEVVQNGIDVNFTGEHNCKRERRFENNGNPIVGTITRLSPQKDLETLLKAAALVIKGVPNAKFLVIGDGEEREKLQSLAENLGLHDSVAFLGYRDDARALLKTFDIFALSSLWEGLPIVVLEAMEAGKPVVATAVDGVREVVEHGKTGLLVKTERPDLMADSVIKLINDPDLANRMGQRGRGRIKRFFSINRVINTVEQIYFSRVFNRRPNILTWTKIYVKKIYSTLQYVAQRVFREGEEGVSVLFYHSLDSGRPLTNFVKQMDYLRNHGYRIISVDEVMSYISGEKELPPRSVCITFDDGYYDNYKSAFPVLQKYDIPATIFLSSKYITQGTGDEIDLRVSERFLSWKEVREMERGGVCLGSHGFEHCDLTRLSHNEVVREILRSKELIEKNLSRRVRHFSYPYGKYNGTIRELVKIAGFTTAFTTDPGFIKPGDDLYSIKRTLIAPSDSLFDLKKKIAGIFV